MSDDEEYYEFEEEFVYEDLVPDMVVSVKSNPMRKLFGVNSSA